MKVYKWYLGHFIYVVMAFVLLLFNSEDSNTIAFGMLLSIVLSVAIYLYNYVLYVVLGKVMDKESIIRFLLAPILLLMFFSPFKSMISQLDFGGDYLPHLIIGFSFGVNLFTYVKIRNKR